MSFWLKSTFVKGYSCESTTSDTKCLKSQKVSVVENRRESIVQHKTSTTQEKDKYTQNAVSQFSRWLHYFM